MRGACVLAAPSPPSSSLPPGSPSPRRCAGSPLAGPCPRGSPRPPRRSSPTATRSSCRSRARPPRRRPRSRPLRHGAGTTAAAPRPARRAPPARPRVAAATTTAWPPEPGDRGGFPGVRLGPRMRCVPLLERTTFLASLEQDAEEARDGEGRLVLLSGEAGVGKTALLERFEADLPDASWAWGACDGLFTPRPLGPLFDIAERWGGDLLAACTDGASREAMFTAFLRRLSGPGRLRVLVVEDLHWADEATLDLLRFLGRRLRGLHALLLVTYRDDGLAPDDPVRTAIGELASERTTRRLTLPPLTEPAVRDLADGARIEPAELYRLTGGNPFFVPEVLGADAAALPVSARDAVLARVAPLPGDARRVLELAALADTRLEPELLDRVHPGAAAGIDACLASGVLSDDGAVLRFRHEIARLAV